MARTCRIAGILGGQRVQRKTIFFRSLAI